ncbi:DotU family type IV/VI secretion system protein [Vibrio lentus]|nr:DotU family type IV/VI secretion system protein [Vibrio lentus]
MPALAVSQQQTDRSSEIIYLFINIGFKGQYREGGAEQLKAFVHQLEQTISLISPPVVFTAARR